MPKMATNLIGAQPRYRGKLLKTGQTTQYSDQLDDGYYEKGLAKRYLVLDTGQYSGACEFELDDETETQSHNCVRDLVTGLMWARYTSAESASVGPETDGKMVWTGTVADIFAYCAAANAAELGGHADWRIPNNSELISLRNMEGTTAAPDATAFPDWPTAFYIWGSTTTPGVTTSAATILFRYGDVYYFDKGGAYYTALVRGGS